MIIWHSCTEKEFNDILNSRIEPIRLLSHEHLGNDGEPMELFVWGDYATSVPVLRSALTVNKETFWRAE